MVQPPRAVVVPEARFAATRVSVSMEAAFCIEALEEALAKHGKPDIFNTDQGSQFTCDAFTARRLQKIWRQRTGMPLRIVAGDLWIGGMVAAKSPDRPSLLIDGDLARSPWLTSAMIEKHGALIVAWWRQPMASPLQFPHVKALGVEGTEIFHVNFGRQGRDLPVYYAIVPPGTKMKTRASTLVRP